MTRRSARALLRGPAGEPVHDARSRTKGACVRGVSRLPPPGGGDIEEISPRCSGSSAPLRAIATGRSDPGRGRAARAALASEGSVRQGRRGRARIRDWRHQLRGAGEGRHHLRTRTAGSFAPSRRHDGYVVALCLTEDARWVAARNRRGGPRLAPVAAPWVRRACRSRFSVACTRSSSACRWPRDRVRRRRRRVRWRTGASSSRTQPVTATGWPMAGLRSGDVACRGPERRGVRRALMGTLLSRRSAADRAPVLQDAARHALTFSSASAEVPAHGHRCPPRYPRARANALPDAAETASRRRRIRCPSYSRPPTRRCMQPTSGRRGCGICVWKHRGIVAALEGMRRRCGFVGTCALTGRRSITTWPRQ